MTLQIAELTDTAHVQPSNFGNKAASLSKLAKKTGTIPDGFCISIDAASRIAEGNTSAYELDVLRRMFNSLLAKSASSKVILRSSSCYEDKIGSQFPGLLSSEKDIDSYDSFLMTIQSCLKSAKRDEILDYYYKNNIDGNAQHLALIAQEQFTCIYSGFAYVTSESIFVEFNSGALQHQANGDIIPLIATYLKNSDDVYDWVLVNKFSVVNDIAYSLLEHMPEFHEALDVFGYEQIIIEFGFSEYGLHIFQARPTEPLRPITYRDDIVFNETCSDVSGVDIGYKAKASKYFINNDLFNKRCIFILPNTSDEEIKDIVLNCTEK